MPFLPTFTAKTQGDNVALFVSSSHLLKYHPTGIVQLVHVIYKAAQFPGPLKKYCSLFVMESKSKREVPVMSFLTQFN